MEADLFAVEVLRCMDGMYILARQGMPQANNAYLHHASGGGKVLCRHTFPGTRIECVVVSEDHSVVLAGTEAGSVADYRVLIYRVQDGTVTMQTFYEAETGTYQSVTAILPYGEDILVGMHDPWEVTAGQETEGGTGSTFQVFVRELVLDE